jgi:hypothetical protein
VGSNQDVLEAGGVAAETGSKMRLVIVQSGGESRMKGSRRRVGAISVLQRAKRHLLGTL